MRGARGLAGLFGLVAVASALALWLAQPEGPPSQAPSSRRIVSLAPAITEALVALEVDAELVGVSDYCPVEGRPRVGTGLTPAYEKIAGLDPSLILTVETQATRLEDLARLAPAREIPWRTYEEVVAGWRTLGTLTGRGAAAEAWAQRFESTLGPRAKAEGPVVLGVLGYPGRKLEEVWYVRVDSLHGRALEAAGATNAMPEAPAGPPRLSLEALVGLDPDVILVLFEDAAGAEAMKAALTEVSALRAAREGRIRAVGGPGALSTGPKMLELVPTMKTALQDLGGAS